MAATPISDREGLRRRIDAVKGRLDLVAVAGKLCGQSGWKRRGREWVGLSPFKAERTPSCTLVPGRGFFKDFSSGAGGDLIRFVQLVLGVPFAEALTWCEIEAGLDVAARDPEAQRAKARREAEAAARWRRREAAEDRRAAARRRDKTRWAYSLAQETRPLLAGVKGEPVPTQALLYLAARLGCDPLGVAELLRCPTSNGLPRPLRHHPAFPYSLHALRDAGPPRELELGGRSEILRPALVAVISGPGFRVPGDAGVVFDDGGASGARAGAGEDPRGPFAGLHVTYLATEEDRARGWADRWGRLRLPLQDGSVAPTKKVYGTAAGGTIRLTPPPAPGASDGGRLALAEGIESALAVRATDPTLAVWAGISLTNLSGPAATQDAEGRALVGARHPEGLRTEKGRPLRLPPVEPDLAAAGRSAWLPGPERAGVFVQVPDRDGKDMHHMGALQERERRLRRAEGRQVVVWPVPEGMDAADAWLAGRTKTESEGAAA
jgi:hypothetical protein